MQYLISFLEGVITFISPCLLPMLPIYISYFAGGGERSVKKTLTAAWGFVLGFTVVFVTLGALAGTLGSFLRTHQTAVNLISGAVVMAFGLNYLGLFRLNFFRGSGRAVQGELGFFSAMAFGVIFSVGWTPCVGAFLGSALMMASQQGKVLVGMGMLLCYSLGLGVPFLVSAVLMVLFAVGIGVSASYLLRTQSNLPTVLIIVFGVLTAFSAAFFIYFSRKLLVAVRLCNANETLSSTEEGERLEELEDALTCIDLVLNDEVEEYDE